MECGHKKTLQVRGGHFLNGGDPGDVIHIAEGRLEVCLDCCRPIGGAARVRMVGQNKHFSENVCWGTPDGARFELQVPGWAFYPGLRGILESGHPA